MPTYEYECTACKRTLTEYHSINEKHEVCPECGGKLVRLISGGAGFKLVGSGWRRPVEYRIREGIEKGKDERRRAESTARDAQPYGDPNAYDPTPTDGL